LIIEEFIQNNKLWKEPENAHTPTDASSDIMRPARIIY
jgi:hypothetical protein